MKTHGVSMRLGLFLTCAVAAWSAEYAPKQGGAASLGFDTARQATDFNPDWLKDGVSGRWLRLRGVAVPEPTGQQAEDGVKGTRLALQKLRSAGLHSCVLLRWPSGDWHKDYLPQDLRMAFEFGRKLGAAYGDLVDAWEVDNEPDLGFVPEAAERYAAFLKATSLGLKAGVAETGRKPEGGNLKPEVSGKDSSLPVLRSIGEGGKSQPPPRVPLVIMAALGLPPGPWLERFAANDGFSYTDGYNYHYYGYAEDFTGVYRQHERAVTELTTARWKPETGNLKPEGSETNSGQLLPLPGWRPTQSASGHSSAMPSPPIGSVRSQVSTFSATPQVSGFSSQVSPDSVQKSLPVFLTEIGYGMLGKSTRDTKEGRLRQWRWFKSVGEQATDLRIEAPMAFQVPPYLERDVLEFGLTVPPRTDPQKPETGNLKPEGWIAGGIKYTAKDFAAKPESGRSGCRGDGEANLPPSPGLRRTGKPEISENPQVSGLKSQVSYPAPWMELIGEEIGGNQITPALAQWMALRAKNKELGGKETKNKEPLTSNSGESRSWTVTTSATSPVVIDFITGEGLQPLKRYNGSFVMGKEPLAPRRPETGNLKPEGDKQLDKLKAASSQLKARSEEFTLHIRTANGNLYEVYPTRQATPEWQTYLEQHDNFTMSFYGRAEPPWRFKDNRPVSLVVVMYPKQLPATYEFRRVQLLRLGKGGHEKAQEGTKTITQDPLTKNRYGSGRILIYNFSDKTITGRLILPEGVATKRHEESQKEINYTDTLLTLQPQERREIEVEITVAAERFERTKALITFTPSDASVPPARFVTEFFPALEGLQTTVVAELLQQKPETGNLNPELLNPQVSGLKSQVSAFTNRDIIANRPRATEEAPSISSSGLRSQVSGFESFAQQGAQVERTSDGLRITVTSTPPGKEQRVEVEIPWPEGQEFPTSSFLSLDYRLVAVVK